MGLPCIDATCWKRCWNRRFSNRAGCWRLFTWAWWLRWRCLLAAFAAELIHAVPNAMRLSEVRFRKVILAVLGLIDLSLAGNLVVIVIFSGYENFVSKIHTENAEDRPSWMGTLDFSGLKMKLIGSIVAISAISLLRAFMTLTEHDVPVDEPRLRWMLMLHLTFWRPACCSPRWIGLGTEPRNPRTLNAKRAAREPPFFIQI